MPDLTSQLPPELEAELMALLAQRSNQEVAQPTADPMHALRGASSIGPLTVEKPLPLGGENQQPDMIAKMIELSGMNNPLEQMGGGPAQAMTPLASMLRNPAVRAAKNAKLSTRAAKMLPAEGAEAVETFTKKYPRFSAKLSEGKDAGKTATQEDYLGSLNPNWHGNLTSTAGTRSEPFAPASDGLGDVVTQLSAFLKNARAKAAPKAAGGEWGEDMLAELGQRAKRLTIPARARAYRSNTPFPE